MSFSWYSTKLLIFILNLQSGPNLGGYYSEYNDAGILENKYNFQGQERQEEFGLNWDQYRWRNSDPAIGRFFNVDPLSEDYYYNSVYAFSENKLVNGIELEGLEYTPSHQQIQMNNWQNFAMERTYSSANGVYRDAVEAYNKSHYTYSDNSQSLTVKYEGVNLDYGPVNDGWMWDLYPSPPTAFDKLYNAMPILGATTIAYDHFEKGEYLKGSLMAGIAISEAVIIYNPAKTSYLPKKVPNSVAASRGSGTYIPRAPLRQQNIAGVDIPLPDKMAASYPHTTLGGKMGSDGIFYRQSATFTGGTWPMANGNIVPWSRVDWSTHGRPMVHPNPHQHIYKWNGTNWYYKGNEPFNY